MIYEVLFQSEVLSEMTEVFEWHQEQKDGLGYEFIEEIEACCKKLNDDPQRFSYINDLYRRIKTDRFRTF